jgi:hypothetical protein
MPGLVPGIHVSYVVIPDGPKDQTSDAQLRIGESRDSGFDASHRPGMTVEEKRGWPGQARP